VFISDAAVGNGELIRREPRVVLLNEAIKKRPNPVVLDFLTADGR